MKNSTMVLAGVTLAFLAGGALAQEAPVKKLRAHGHAARNDVSAESGGYRPLTVGGPRRVARPVAAAAGAVGDVGAAVAAPFNTAAQVGGPVGVGLGIAGGAVGGAATLATAPLVGLLGGPVGISPNPAPPLPIKARFANTGAVANTIDEGFSQDVPVDKSGPIYMIDTTGTERTVSPFSLLAFPITGAASVITAPLRAASAPGV